MKNLGKVILVIAFVAILSILLYIAFSYADIDEENFSEGDFLQGWVADAYDTGDNYENYAIWNITLTSRYNMYPELGTSYLCYFINNLSAPPEDVHLKLFYNIIPELGLYEIYKVKSL